MIRPGLLAISLLVPLQETPSLAGWSPWPAAAAGARVEGDRALPADEIRTLASP